MVRTSILLAGYACAAETGSLMQSHNGEFGSAGDVSYRLSKLADLKMTTKRMEEEYKAMAHSLIRGPNDYAKPHNKTLFDGDSREADKMFETVSSQLNELLWQLDQEKDTNQDLVNRARAGVVAANTKKYNAFKQEGVGVEARLAVLTDARQGHVACRTDENQAIEIRDASCSTFVAHAVCQVHEDDYNYFAKSSPGDYQSVPQKLLDAVADAKECRKDLAVERKQSKECDEIQIWFESAYCLYHRKLTDTCDALDEDYAKAKLYWDQVVASVSDLERDQKVVYTMIQKIACYIKEMKAKFKTLASADIKTCEDLQPDSGKLDITKNPPPAKDECSLALVDHGVPGDAAWKKFEYEKEVFTKHHEKTYSGTGDQVAILDTIVSCNTRLSKSENV